MSGRHRYGICTSSISRFMWNGVGRLESQSLRRNIVIKCRIAALIQVEQKVAQSGHLKSRL
jgi:hypothetical protein